MPRYMIMLVERENDDIDEAHPDFAGLMQAHRDFADAVRDAGGAVLSSDALRPTSTATFLRNTRSSDVVVVDNPLPDLKEVLGGYYVIEAADDAQAVELAKLCPAPWGYVEVRPVWVFESPDDVAG